MSNCDSGSCSTETSSCNTTSTQASCPTQSGAGKQSDCCPLEQSINMWQGSFFQALQSVQVDLLRDRIKKEWGSTMEEEADAIVSAMGTCWSSKLAQGKAQCDLRESFKSIFTKKVK